jgi:biotin carboxyl carrier protein
MIYHVQIDEREYQVEIEDLDARPVAVKVNGQDVQVWVEEAGAQAAGPHTFSAPTPVPPKIAPAHRSTVSAKEVCAPMPGTIVSVEVQPGDGVQVGQDLCVLDAMKMNNRIRAHRQGTIKQVHVSSGQQVLHGDLLITFSD